MLRRLKERKKRRLEARCKAEKDRGFNIAIRKLILEGQPTSCVEHLENITHPATPERIAFAQGARVARHFIEDHREYYQGYRDFHSHSRNWCKKCHETFEWRGVRCGKCDADMNQVTYAERERKKKEDRKAMIEDYLEDAECKLKEARKAGIFSGVKKFRRLVERLKSELKAMGVKEDEETKH